MKKIKLLLVDHPNQKLSEGTEVEFLVEDFLDQIHEDIFFHSLRALVRPNVRIFDASARPVVDFLRGKFQEVGIDPKL